MLLSASLMHLFRAVWIFLLIVGIATVSAAESNSAVKLRSKVLDTGAWKPSARDIDQALVATREYLHQTIAESSDELSVVFWKTIDENWARYFCLVKPIIREGRRTLDVSFILAAAESEMPDLVSKLAEGGGTQWGSSYDVDMKIVRSLQSHIPSLYRNPQAAPLDDTLTVDFPDEIVGVVIKNVAELYGVYAAIPEELFLVKTTIKVRDVNCMQLMNLAVAGAGYRAVLKGKVISFQKIETKR